MAALLILFLLTAAGGALFAVLESRGMRPPLKLTSLHGLLGLFSIALLIVWDVDHPGLYYANAAAVVFILTALGGSLLFLFRALRQRLPLAVVLLHGAFGLVALLLLGIACYKG